MEDYYNAKKYRNRLNDEYQEWNERFVIGIYHDEPDTHR